MHSRDSYQRCGVLVSWFIIVKKWYTQLSRFSSFWLPTNFHSMGSQSNKAPLRLIHTGSIRFFFIKRTFGTWHWPHSTIWASHADLGVIYKFGRWCTSVSANSSQYKLISLKHFFLCWNGCNGDTYAAMLGSVWRNHINKRTLSPLSITLPPS